MTNWTMYLPINISEVVSTIEFNAAKIRFFNHIMFLQCFRNLPGNSF